MGVCSVCGGTRFTLTTYKLASGGAPALECTGCLALTLEEDAAMSDDERASVRQAKAQRAAASTRPPPPSSRITGVTVPRNAVPVFDKDDES